MCSVLRQLTEDAQPLLDATRYTNSHANILIPQLRPRLDEIAHELDARRIVQDFHRLQHGQFVSEFQSILTATVL
jgi:hypothetical protein